MVKFVFQIDLSQCKISEQEIADINKLQQKMLFENILNQGMQSKYPNGITNKLSRDYAKILKKLDKAPGNFLELEDSEFDIVKDMFTNEGSRFLPAQTRLVQLYSEQVDIAVDAKKAAAGK